MLNHATPAEYSTWSWLTWPHHTRVSPEQGVSGGETLGTRMGFSVSDTFDRLYECLKLANVSFNPVSMLPELSATRLTTWSIWNTVGDRGQHVISPIRKKAKNAVVHIALNKYARYSLEHKVGVCCNILRRIGSVIGKRVSWREAVNQAFHILSTFQVPKRL